MELRTMEIRIAESRDDTLETVLERLRQCEERERFREERDAEIAKFYAVIDSQEEEITQAVAVIEETKKAYDAAKNALHEKKAYDAAKETLTELQSIRDGAKENLINFVSPNRKVQILPLFDQMEKADEEIHGPNSAVWRNESVGSAGIGLVALLALEEANVALIGVLQDRVLKSPNDWWKDISGLGAESAKRVVERLNDFIFQKTRG